MKAVAGVLILVFILSFPSFAFKSEPNGFRDLKWGDAPLKNMEYESQFHGMKVYTTLDEKLTIGEVRVEHIRYLFWEKRFIMAVVLYEGKKRSRQLEDILIGLFGKPDLDLDSRVKWNGEQTTIVFRYDSADESGILGLTSTQLLRKKMKEDRQEAAGGAKEDF